jgi:hypothetical protein
VRREKMSERIDIHNQIWDEQDRIIGYIHADDPKHALSWRVERDDMGRILHCVHGQDPKHPKSFKPFYDVRVEVPGLGEVIVWEARIYGDGRCELLADGEVAITVLRPGIGK